MSGVEEIAAEMADEPWRFDVLAALRRLEHHFADRPRIGDSATRRDDFVALGQDPFLAFPAENLSAVSRDAEGRVRMMVRFLGMMGPQGALPLATTEEAYGWWLAQDDAFPRFLDLFNHRFLQLFFRAWADARPVAQHDRPDEDRFADYVGALIGIATPCHRGIDSVDDRDRLAYAGLLAPRTKSAGRLRDFLAGLFDVEVEIDQFVGSSLPLDADEWSILGRRNSGLGVDVLLGRRLFSVEDKIRIRVLAPDLAQYERFLPGGDRARPMADAVFFYLGAQMEVEVELGLPAEKTEAVRLGRSGRLGWTTWVAPDWAGLGGTLRTDARLDIGERLRPSTEAAA